ncbi:hypothetical protein ACSBR2_007379 [Camellia fascicularis]
MFLNLGCNEGCENTQLAQRVAIGTRISPNCTEFADPIAYISRIEKEASAFVICKVIPPLPKPSKNYVISNLNKSFSKYPELGPNTNLAEVCSSSKTDSGNEANDREARAVFTTRHRELGQNARTIKKVVRKQVWQSGQIYTLEQFESKSKAFARSQFGMVKDLSPLVIEALFWKAVSEKPINIEYANDVPGSGFGEPEGSFQYFYRQRRRRKRTFNRNSGGSCDSKKYQVNNTSNSGENKGVSTKNSSNSFRERSRVSISLPTILSNQISGCSRQKSSNAAYEMEGTAGWKLSNSPWNLQVIARSPGSHTRFMPDDIPGVTSPMVYIGMLFSWFAWHVEDHELHILNFLHTGSPKTWYTVPGDYAFSFEGVIRNQAYGGNIDRLASLTLLGKKTTLLSPEVVVKSGIPCCRCVACSVIFGSSYSCPHLQLMDRIMIPLFQNPGEFVVTFPRAYHVGFSHGFNCGEAANFGTSKWLKVAKEAASAKILNARGTKISSERSPEGRERAVILWDLESLPSPSKESERCIATVVTTPREDVCSENKNIETMDDLYVNDDDFSCDFEVDSRTLACVACGIRGFPFMCVVQPSERVSMSLLQDVGVSKPLGCHSHPVLHDMIEGFISDGMKDKIEQNESNVLHHPNGASSSAKSIKSTACSSEDLSSVPDLFPPPGDLPVSLEVKFDKGWSATRGFLRPRIICLEHAIQIEEMLRSKGGANFFVPYAELNYET